MSSPEDNDSENAVLKKRRVQRACDICRRKKVRCDGGQMPENRCSNCVTYNYECTYIEAAKKRGPPKGYVESLETRLEKMEKLLHKLCPDADFTQELGGHFNKEAWYSERGDKAATSSASTSTITPSLPPVDTDDLDPSDDEITAQHTLDQTLKRLEINPGHMRFFGKSSSVMFIQTAIDLKQEYTGIESKVDHREDGKPTLRAKRDQFWNTHPWIMPALAHEKLQQTFPEPDLMRALIDLYFEDVNFFMPLLHRPTFEDNVKHGLHLTDEGFGSVLLLVCALGARSSDDPRVFLEGFDSTHSAGWKWFKQVHLVRKSLLAPPRLYDLQIYCLSAAFLGGTSAPQACWTVIGVGIRLAQDVGAHRRKVYNPVRSVEEELWKRAFWVLVAMDRSISAALGRPCAIQDEDFDLDLPVECDDEYWTHPNPELAFKQPAGKPSQMTFFNCALRLNQILAFALRTIYSINKSKALLGFVGHQWEQHIVAELDSALNKWIDSVPDHLRWDPKMENLVFMNQSALLYAGYYQLQIAVHRPFIPSPRKPSPLSFPSLAICTNAARSCIHVLDVLFKRTGKVLIPNQMALFTSGIVLLLNIWGGKRSGLTADPVKEMAEVHKSMKMLKALEPRYHTAGRLWDVLYELASVGDLPLPQPSPTPSHKRERDSDSPIGYSTAPSPAETNMQIPAEGPRNIAGSKRVSRDSYAQQQRLLSHTPNAGVPALNDHFPLPTHSSELGRLPLHPAFSHDPSAAGSWYAMNQMPSVPGPSQVPAASEPVEATFDPAIAAMFNLSPSLYEQVMTDMNTPLFAPSTSQDYQMPLGSGMPPAPDESVSMQDASAFLDSDTLAIWSSAPSGFEWSDWGSYIAGVSGLTHTSDPPGQRASET